MTTTVAKQALMTMRSLLTLPVRSDRSFLYRLASTASTAGLLSTPTRAPPSSTTFSGKASPRDSHDPPEYPRGLPQTSKFISSSQPRYPMSQATMDAFDGPSRPRLLSDRVGRRDLPPLKVSELIEVSNELSIDSIVRTRYRCVRCRHENLQG